MARKPHSGNGTGNSTEKHQRWPAIKLRYAYVESANGAALAALDIALINGDISELDGCHGTAVIHIKDHVGTEHWLPVQQAFRVLQLLAVKYTAEKIQKAAQAAQ